MTTPTRVKNIQGIGMTSRRTRERLIGRLRDKGINSEAVLQAIAETPRHLFVEEALAHQAYDDNALPIGHGQTISQPWVVARMVELLLGANGCQKVLEVGTGCGYQAAVLSSLVNKVYSVERIKPLLAGARTLLGELKMKNVQVKFADGAMGWPDEAPFDGIIVACARAAIPFELLQQLCDGGRLVMPVSEGRKQWLTLVERNGKELLTTRLEQVNFVPFMNGIQ